MPQHRPNGGAVLSDAGALASRIVGVGLWKSLEYCWGIWESDFGSIEFNVETDPAEGMMLHVRAEAAVAPAIAQLCAENGWQGIDCGSGEFIERSQQPEEVLLAWTAYRNRVVGLDDSI